MIPWVSGINDGGLKKIYTVKVSPGYDGRERLFSIRFAYGSKSIRGHQCMYVIGEHTVV